MATISKELAKDAYRWTAYSSHRDPNGLQAAVIVTGANHKTHLSLAMIENGAFWMTHPICGSERIGTGVNRDILSPETEISCGRCARSKYAKPVGR